MLMQNLPFYNRTVAKIITFLLPTACEVAGCYFDFSGSGMICQAGLPSTVVARHKGNRKKMLVVSVEKGGECLCITFKALLVSAYAARQGILSKFFNGNLRVSRRMGVRCDKFPKIPQKFLGFALCLLG